MRQKCDKTDWPVETRWMLLTGSGQVSWLGRATDPSDDLIKRTALRLDDLNIIGWLTLARGDFMQKPPDVILIKRISAKDGDYDKALENYKMSFLKAVKQIFI